MDFQNFVKTTIAGELFNRDLFEEWLRDRLKYGVGFVGVHDDNLPTENYMKQLVDKYGGGITLFIHFELSSVIVYDIVERVTLPKPEWVLDLEAKLYENHRMQSVLAEEVLALLD